MNQDIPNIRQVLFIVDKSRKYKFDVNQTVTIKNLKKMIIAAANLGRSGMKIYHKGIEYTHMDDSCLIDLFPDLQLVEFTMNIIYPDEDEMEQSLKMKFGSYCPKHNYKYPYFYCYDCMSSICSMCLQNGEHTTHNYIEKYDYLQSSKNLVETIFYDLKDYLKGCKFDESNIEEFKMKIKLHSFPLLREMLSKVEMRILELIDFYNENDKISFFNMQKNFGLLKNHCSEGLDKLKNEIEIEEIMVDEEIFLTFDRKFKEISTQKLRIANDTKKYDEMRKTMIDVVSIGENIYFDIFNLLDKFLKTPTFNDVKLKISEFSVSKVSKDEIIVKFLSDLKKKISRTGSKYLETPTNSIFKSYMSDASENKEGNYVPSRDTTPCPVTLNFENINNPTMQKNAIIISQCIPETKDISSYNNTTGLLTQHSVVFNPFLGISEFLANCAVLNVNGKLYISGGIDNSAPSSSFFVYDSHTDEITKLPNLLYPRYSHSMYFHDNFIYFVGGSYNSTEKFDIEELKFTKLANIVCEERFSPVLYVQGNFLYAFFGNTKGSYADTIEKLNFKNEKAKWELVAYKNPMQADLKMIGCGIVPNGDIEILMFGGKSRDHIKNSKVKFNFANHTFEIVDLVIEAEIYFQESLMTDLGENIYGLFSSKNLGNFFKIRLNNQK